MLPPPPAPPSARPGADRDVRTYTLFGAAASAAVIASVFLPWQQVLRRPADGWQSVAGVDAPGGPLALVLGVVTLLLLIGSVFVAKPAVLRGGLMFAAVAAVVAAVAGAWSFDVWQVLWGDDDTRSDAGVGRYVCILAGTAAAVFASLAAARSAHDTAVVRN